MSASISEALQARDIAMRLVTDHANKQVPGWSAAAFDYLLRYSMEHATVNSEDLTDSAYDSGPPALRDVPVDARAWGPIFQRAARLKFIVRTDKTYHRRHGNGTLGLLWASRLYLPTPRVARQTEPARQLELC